MCEEGNLPRCELCKEQARVYCEADKASLCWQCDAEVHGANFLVAKHRRTRLCHACGAAALWLKAGFSMDLNEPFCQHCFHDANCCNESDKLDEKSRTLGSRASSTMSYVSPNNLQQYCETEGNVKWLKNMKLEDSKAWRTRDSSCSASVARVLQLLRGKNAAELIKQVKMCLMPVTSTRDKPEIAAIYNNLRQRQLSCNTEENERKICASLRRVLDGYATEESSSRLRTSARRPSRNRSRLRTSARRGRRKGRLDSEERNGER